MTKPIARRMFVTPFTISASAVQGIPVALDDAYLDKVRIIIPPGHSGLTALQIQLSGQPYWPKGADPFIRGDNEIIDYEWGDEIQENAISLLGFNADVFPHTWTLRWELTDLSTQASTATIDSPQLTIPAVTDLATIANLTSADLLTTG